MEKKAFTRTTRQIEKILDGRTEEQQQNDFLDQFEKTCNVSKACKKAKVSRSVLYARWMVDEDFKKAFAASQSIAAKLLEDEMTRRAHEGVLEPVYQGGKKVGTIRKYSDTLLIVLMKAHDPERFKERSWMEMSGKGGGPINVKGHITHAVTFKNSKQDPADAVPKEEGE